MLKSKRKAISCFLVALFVFMMMVGGLPMSFQTNVSAATNLIQNPGGETGALSPWSGTGSIGTNRVKTGTKSFLVQRDQYVQQVVTGLTPNTTYQLKGWLYVDGSNSIARLGATGFGGTDISQAVMVGNTWTQVTMNFTTGTAATSATIKLWQGTEGWSWCYGDDIELYSTASNTPTPTSVTATPTSATPTPTPSGGINIVLNPGFESGSTSWSLSSHASITSLNKNSGSNALMLSGIGDWCNTTQTINVTENTTYTVSFYGKCGAAQNIRILNSSWSLIIEKTTTANNTWTNYSTTFNSGSNSQIILCITDNSSGTSYFDDFSISTGSVGVTPTPVVTATPTPGLTPTPTPGSTPIPGKMFISANFWRIDWGSNGWREYFKDGLDWNTTTDPWNPTFISDLQNIGYKAIRFMDWGPTNGSTLVNWSDRIPKTANHYTTNGVAYEWMIDLCNKVGADMWICVPHQATPSFTNSLATLIKNNLNSNRKVYVEWSNEVWNYSFEQNTWIRNAGRVAGLPENLTTSDGRTVYCDGDKIWNNYVYYSCRALNEFNNVFGVNSPRVVKVLGGQLGYEPWGGNITAPQADFHLAATRNSTINPWNVKIDAYAVAPYWWGDSVSAMRSSLTTLEKWLGYHRNSLTADGRGIQLMAYEGGSDGSVSANEDPGQYQLNIDALDVMKKYIQGSFNYYTHLGADATHYWGLKKYTGQPESEAHKWRGVKQWIANNP